MGRSFPSFQDTSKELQESFQQFTNIALEPVNGVMNAMVGSIALAMTQMNQFVASVQATTNSLQDLGPSKLEPGYYIVEKVTAKEEDDPQREDTILTVKVRKIGADVTQTLVAPWGDKNQLPKEGDAIVPEPSSGKFPMGRFRFPNAFEAFRYRKLHTHR